MKRFSFLIVLVLVVTQFTYAQGKKEELWEIVLVKNENGQFYQYAPKKVKKPYRFLVIIHGMVGEKSTAKDAARNDIRSTRNISNPGKILKSYAKENGVILIVPIFDKYNYGSYEGPIGGYRGLAGRKIDADVFLNQIIDSYKKTLKGYKGKFSIIGHSAGGQFVGRYIAKYPERIIAASIIAPGTYLSFDEKVDYPYGLKKCCWLLDWKGMAKEDQKIMQYTPDKEKLKEMFKLRIRVIVGSKDTYKYSPYVGQVGLTRIDRGRGWVISAKEYAKSIGVNDNIKFIFLKGEGHRTPKLFASATKGMFRK